MLRPVSSGTEREQQAGGTADFWGLFLMTKKNERGSGNGLDSYDVGYGKPPVHTRFKKGAIRQSERPAERLKSFSEKFEEVLGSEITVNLPEGPRCISFREVVIRRLTGLATEGNLTPLGFFWNTIRFSHSG